MIERCQASAKRALDAFLLLTAPDSEAPPCSTSPHAALHTAALRALVLLILRSLAPAFFRREDQQPSLDESMRQLASWPLPHDDALDGDDVIAISDTYYLCALAGQPRAVDAEVSAAVERALCRIEREGDPLTPWLTSELMVRGGARRFALRPEPFLEPPQFQVYVDSHVIFLARSYGIVPGGRFTAGEPTERERAALERMHRAVPELVTLKAYDALAEIALCTQLLGGDNSDRQRDIVALLLDTLNDRGELTDHTYAESGLPDHATGLALLIFARQGWAE